MNNCLYKVSLAFSFFLLINFQQVTAQEKQYRLGCIAFYNLENLFDTVNDPNINDEEFLPTGKYEWTGPKYLHKIKNMAEVISQIGDELVKGGPVILGVSEIENRKVLEDLIATPPLNKFSYGIVHYDSPDKRGVDVGLIYQTAHFRVTASKAVPLRVADRPDWTTRDQLVVSGLLDNEPIHVIVNHWPSRSGGEQETAPLRQAAASLCRMIADSLLKLDPNARIIIMGDLNDNPTDISLVKNLKAKESINNTGPNDLYNPMYKMYKQEGLGSLAYRDSWSLFDQIILSKSLLGDDRSTFKLYKTKVFNRPFLTQKEGAFTGYPFRTYAGGVFMGGYSDHFPVYIFLIKEKK
ncbi:MAG: endonuclease/exonuclease/phosphatase family protein [Bacteroidetes bacterium]|nr:endonuclease/exonuclease/phosphatase family protein [Bacteroidota bacterium]